jgi:outer membrane protein OmpA-like peptidoglycan-associated protein
MSHHAGRLLIRVLCPPIAFLTLPLLLVACGGAPGASPKIIVFAASVTMNEPAAVLAPDDSSLLYQAGATSTMAVAYVVDPNTGQPTRVSLTPRRADGQVEYGPNRLRILRENVEQVQRALNREVATGPFDLIGEIASAIRVTRSPATLIVLSSGLSTAGALDLRQLGWDVNPQAIAAQLNGRGQLPDLTGWHVVFSGLADTAGRQPPLPLPQRAELTALWIAICHTANAASCTVDGITRPDPRSHSTRPVPVVPVPEVISIQMPHHVTSTTVPAAEFFAFNSALLLPGADIILGPLAAITRARHLSVSITGYASPDGGTDAYNNALSGRRARAVAARLIILGVPARHIVKIIGDGTAGKIHRICYIQGRLDESVCAKLRRVVILLSPPPAISH